jgi:hypothetical protein
VLEVGICQDANLAVRTRKRVGCPYNRFARKQVESKDVPRSVWRRVDITMSSSSGKLTSRTDTFQARDGILGCHVGIVAENVPGSYSKQKQRPGKKKKE